MRQKRYSYEKDFLIMTVFLVFATLSAAFCFHMAGMKGHMDIVYVLFIVLISKYTSGYLWGLLGSIVAVLEINFFFSEPYLKLDFTKPGYAVTFIGMLVLSMVIGTLTSHFREHQKLLLEAEREKMRSNLLRAISHDVRTPLTGIIGASQACLENPAISREEVDQMMQNIYEDSSWLLNMVENILSVTRIGSGDTSVKTSLEPLDEILSDSILRFKKRYPKSKVVLKLPPEIVMVNIDSILIEQVVINLLENAEKYAGSEEPILLKAEIAETRVRVSVRDYGKGIPHDKMKHLFSGTDACRDSRCDSKRGMGLGLSICKTIILAHGGEIKAINRADGAEVCFWLPLEGEENESEKTDTDY